MIEVEEIVGDEYKCICPFHDDKKGSLYINVNKNAAICFAGCVQGSAVDVVSKIEKLPKKIAWYRMVSRDVFYFNDTVNLKDIEPVNFDTNKEITWIPADKNNYLIERGFARSTIRLWNIEYSPEINHIRIPVYDGDKLICYSYRTTEDNVEPRYVHPGFPKKNGLLFGEHMFESHFGKIILVEGSLDCIWLWQNNFRNSLAFLGVPSKAQILNLLERGEKYVICLDNDDAGKRVSEKLSKIFEKKNKLFYEVEFPKDIKDIQEVQKNNIFNLICNKKGR